MEGIVSAFELISGTRKKRSNTSRRPRTAPLSFLNIHTSSSIGDNASFITGFKRKEIDLSNSAAYSSSYNRAEGEGSIKKPRNDDGAFKCYMKRGSRGEPSSRHEQLQSVSDVKRTSEGMLAPANWKSNSKGKDGLESQSRNSGSDHSSRQPTVSSSEMGVRGNSYSSHENKLKKMKLKVGGVTHMIHPKSSQDDVTPHAKPSHSLEIPWQQQKMILQDNSDNGHSPPDQINNLHGVFGKDLHSGRMSKEMHSQGSEPSSELVRKSRRVQKRRVLDGIFDDAGEAEESHYLERLKTNEAGMDCGNEFMQNGEESKKRESSRSSRRKLIDREYEDNDNVEGYGSLKTMKEGRKKSRNERESEDDHSIEDCAEDDLGSDLVFKTKRKKLKQGFVDSLMDIKKEMPLTMRQKALQSGTDEPTGINASSIEFPNGLPPAPPRKQKEKLSEMEQQLKKAEAAQRRKMQNEKAALESQREAIKKILGQDSSRKKREDQLRKRRDELAQEKAANAMVIASNSVRWVLGPSGTTVTFPEDVGLPSIFNQRPCSYPPPREKCAAPSCTNFYKYRDSKSRLPLCSLQCYQAMHEVTRPVTTC